MYPLFLQIITPDIEDDETQYIEFEIEVLSNLRGDADGDGIISKADAEAIEQYLSSENQEGLTEQGESNADVDNDGMITAADASAILHYLEKGYFPDEEPVQTGTTTAPVTTTTSAAHTVTTTTTAVPCAKIILVPPTKTRYTVGEPLDFSDMSCKVFFTGFTSGTATAQTKRNIPAAWMASARMIRSATICSMTSALYTASAAVRR